MLRKFIGPGYVRCGPVTAGCFGIGCLFPTLVILAVGVGIVVML